MSTVAPSELFIEGKLSTTVELKKYTHYHNSVMILLTCYCPIFGVFTVMIQHTGTATKGRKMRIDNCDDVAGDKHTQAQLMEDFPGKSTHTFNWFFILLLSELGNSLCLWGKFCIKSRQMFCKCTVNKQKNIYILPLFNFLMHFLPPEVSVVPRFVCVMAS